MTRQEQQSAELMMGGGGESTRTQIAPDPVFLPMLVSSKEALPNVNNSNSTADTNNLEENAHVYIQILAIRRQHIVEEERFHEDASTVNVQLTFLDADDKPPPIMQEEDDDDEEFGRGSKTYIQNGAHPNILKKIMHRSTHGHFLTSTCSHQISPAPAL